MSVAGTCIMFQLMFTVPGLPAGKATWNLDGSWTVDNWPAVEAAANKVAVYVPPEPSEEDKANGTGVVYLTRRQISYEILMARALVSARNAGKLWENPDADNTCPEE